MEGHHQPSEDELQPLTSQESKQQEAVGEDKEERRSDEDECQEGSATDEPADEEEVVSRPSKKRKRRPGEEQEEQESVGNELVDEQQADPPPPKRSKRRYIKPTPPHQFTEETRTKRRGDRTKKHFYGFIDHREPLPSCWDTIPLEQLAYHYPNHIRGTVLRRFMLAHRGEGFIMRNMHPAARAQLPKTGAAYLRKYIADERKIMAQEEAGLSKMAIDFTVDASLPHPVPGWYDPSVRPEGDVTRSSDDEGASLQKLKDLLSEQEQVRRRIEQLVNDTPSLQHAQMNAGVMSDGPVLVGINDEMLARSNTAAERTLPSTRTPAHQPRLPQVSGNLQDYPFNPVDPTMPPPPAYSLPRRKLNLPPPRPPRREGPDLQQAYHHYLQNKGLFQTDDFMLNEPEQEPSWDDN
ncbi:MAG: hypothetical protein Q9160_004259 [Pyrenula sp. 1 TL-2023]